MCLSLRTCAAAGLVACSFIGTLPSLLSAGALPRCLCLPGAAWGDWGADPTQHTFISPHSAGWTSGIRAPARSVSEASLFGLQTAASVLCAYVVFPVCVRVGGGRVCTHIPGVSAVS